MSFKVRDISPFKDASVCIGGGGCIQVESSVTHSSKVAWVQPFLILPEVRFHDFSQNLFLNASCDFLVFNICFSNATCTDRYASASWPFTPCTFSRCPRFKRSRRPRSSWRGAWRASSPGPPGARKKRKMFAKTIYKENINKMMKRRRGGRLPSAS